ncbi:PilN domain-containing protein [Phorcysia thermohydrogeniphila]|uniref:Type IV pilus assembly protein PilN n=1 Tax=Phorcysia thermohydrogeniphila TaxID=936138 RepID=A0A4R1GER3_9BACT|nr:PilN domain-containing protein [Phorcysia thermohydrogeniphila]TCK06478.1 type IV pilus assembly protein PilN [Phorcysia thermohydrogeniphila]
MLRFNFADVKESRLEKYLKPDVIFAVLIVFLALAVGALMESNLKEEVSVVKSRIAQLEAEKKRLRKIEKQEKVLREKQQELERKLAIVRELSERRKVPAFLYFFADPENMQGVWLTSLAVKGNQLELEGNCKTLEEMYRFIDKVDRKLGTVTFKEAKLETFEEEKLNFKVNYYNFSLSAELKNGVSN